MFNRYWKIGWTSAKEYVKSKWAFSFCYYKRMVWQLRLFGFYITSTYKPSMKIEKVGE